MELNEALQVLLEYGKQLVRQMHDAYHEDVDSYAGIYDVLDEYVTSKEDIVAVLLATGEIGFAFECASEDVANDVYKCEMVYR